MILCIGPTPALQRVMRFRQLKLDAVNRAVLTLEGAAGKGVNVAKVLKSLGQNPLATGFLGGERGRQLQAILDAKGIESDFVQVKSPTRLCVTVIDESAVTHTELVEESLPVAAEDYVALEHVVQKHVSGCRAVVMSGTLTPGGPAEFYLRCTQLGKNSGALAVVDAHGVPLMEALKARPALIKPNRVELGATVGRELSDEKHLRSAMEEIAERGAERIVVTSGKQPVMAFDGRKFWRIRPPVITPVNPIGSGDAFTAGLVWRLVRGDDLAEACRWGTAAGAANALTAMAGEVEPARVEELAPGVVVESV